LARDARRHICSNRLAGTRRFVFDRYRRSGEGRRAALLEGQYPTDPKTLSRKAGEIRDFIARMQDGDVVLAADGERVLGVGHATGPYFYEQTEPTGAPHRRPVKWSSTEEWKLPTSEGLRTTFFPIGRYPDNIIERQDRRFRLLPPSL
jgi:5-methylcytosine-specific restriction protein B